MNDISWYEIDDAQDLSIANALFLKGKEKYKAITSTYGGFWRYKKIIDFCYLVNPYFPPKQMVEKMQIELPTLLTQYPSGLRVQNMNAERLFGVDENHIFVGNGAAELINALGHISKGKKVGVNIPAFNEYVRCFKDSEILEIDNSKHDYKLDMTSIKSMIDKADITVVINPDNPSGNFLAKKDVLSLLKELKKRNIKADVVVLDPPRKGCEQSVLEIVANDFCPKRIVYVSCDPSTLARDVSVLNSLGYNLKEYTPFDLFPRTTHIETVGLLYRNDMNS
jgi:hypothetical protein